MSENQNTDSHERDRHVSELLLRACHDLRAPLRAIRTHSELILKNTDLPADKLTERLAFVVDGAQRMERLLHGLAQYSIALQIDEASFQTTGADVLIRAVLQKLDPEMRETRAVVKFEKLPRIRGNSQRLMELFENLIRNAISHRGSAAPVIEITATEKSHSWVFAVHDNGPGIESLYLEKIFAPFERLNSSQHSGVGLGLAICRVIVEKHGGSIWAESQPGEGSTFLFTLPASGRAASISERPVPKLLHPGN